MNEYASEVANSIKFRRGRIGGCVERRADRCNIVIDRAWPDRTPDSRTPPGSGPHVPKVAGCAGQRVSVAAYCTEYFVGWLNPSGPRRGEGVRPRGRFGRTKWFIASMSRSSSVQVSQR
jgi:hypothetical protein